MKKLLWAGVALGLLSACEVPPSDEITVNPEGINRVEEMGLDAVAPNVSPQVAIQTFATFCGPYPANPAATRRAVEAEGYVLFASGTTEGLDMFVSPDGRPMVATGRSDGAEVCMVMMQEGRDLSRVVEAYVNQRHGGSAIYVGEMPTPEGTAENVWASLDTPPIIYFTLVQSQPGLGRVEAIAQVTE